MTSNTLLARFDQTPALVNPEQQMIFDACLASAANFLANNEEKLAEVGARAECAQNEDGYWPDPASWEARYKPYKVMNGTLHIPVKGVLINNFGYTISDWITGYEYITRALQRGLADGNVDRIALIVDSPGGEVAGCFECADKIMNARVVKPIQGFANESAYSAAYAIVSAASKVHVSRTGGVGSIGVVTSHTDVSKRYEVMGVKITFIHAGRHKVDGNAFEPLPDEVKARIQARIDELYGVFVSTVALHRIMDEEDVRATEALTFTASEALSNGLADSVGPLDEALASFEAELSNETENEPMSSNKDTSAPDEAAVNAAREEGMTAGRTEGMATGRTEERTRISTILGSDEAKSRPAAAMNVAMKTDMTAEDAAAFLADMPEESTASSEGDGGTTAGAGAGGNRFDNAMHNSGNPDLAGNDDGEGEGAQSTKGGANELIASRAAATGFGRKAK